jgi:hypothetical protein
MKNPHPPPGVAWSLEEAHDCLKELSMSFAKDFTSLDELKDESVMVLVGRAISHDSALTQPGNMPWTTTEVDVERMLLNRLDFKPERVLVRQAGPNTETIHISAAHPLPELGERYLLFLTPAVVVHDVYYPVGAYQGVYQIRADETVHPIPGLNRAWPVPIRGALLTDIAHALDQ